MFLNSPSRFNKLSLSTLHEILLALRALEADPAVVCLVITGYPGESFAVGADIGQMAHFSAADALAFADLGQTLFSTIEGCPKPVIAALNGITMGGGCDLALACDIRLAASSMVMAHPGAKLGIITGFCGTQKLPRVIGKGAALEIFMTADPINALDALRVGFVNHVYADGDFWVRVEDYARRIAAASPEALAAVKRVTNAAEDLDLKNGCFFERECYCSLVGSLKLQTAKEGNNR